MKNILAAFAAISLLAVSPAIAGSDGDAVKGKKDYKKCAACHAVGEGAKAKVGPQLNNIFGKTIGTQEGYKYSKAMIAKGEEGAVWDDETMAAFLKRPKDYIKKTKMSFVGFKKREKRIANVIAYLKTFSDE